MNVTTGPRTAKATFDTATTINPAAGVDAIEQITKTSTEALTKSSTAAMAGFRELTDAYQAIATKNSEKLSASIQQLTAVKNPIEFISLLQKQMGENVSDAIADNAAIAKLTAALFTAAIPRAGD